MTGDNQPQLQQAYDLIRQERFEDARLLLRPIILDEPSADAWWLWANAVTEPEEARHALSHVLELAPTHPQARQLLTRLEEAYPAAPVTAPIASASLAGTARLASSEEVEAGSPPALPQDREEDSEPTIHQLERTTDDSEAALDFSEWLEDLAEDEQAETPEVAVAADAPLEAPVVPQNRRRSVFRSVLLVLLVVVIGLGLAVILLQLNGESQRATPDQPEWTAVTEPTERQQNVLQAAQQGIEAVALGGPAVVHLVEYQDGAALLVKVCRGAGPDLPAALRIGMEQVARYGISAQDELSHVGVALVNCDRQDVLAEAMATIEDAASFASGVLNSAAYQAAWQINP